MNRSTKNTAQNTSIKTRSFSLTALLILISTLFVSPLNAQSLDAFFDATDAFMKIHVQDGKVDYHKVHLDPSYNDLITSIGKADLSQANAATQQAFYINAYNLLVIRGVVEAYPINSVLEVGGFFKSKKYLVAGEKLTLEQIEQVKLVKAFGDPRFHFVLVCGALGCPPITNFAYRPEALEEQMDRQTRLAMDDDYFLRVQPEKNAAELSSIFDWYQKDFGGSVKAVRSFINSYRSEPLPEDYKLSYYTYDWTLNAGMEDNSTELGNRGNEPERYIASAAITRGNTETKVFSGIYTQQLNQESRSNFFTSQVSFLYGIKPGLNVGFDLRYRRVSNGGFEDSPWRVLGRLRPGQDRHGITNIGPKVRWAPKANWPNFSIQSSFGLPVGRSLEGDATRPYIDWNGATSWTQIFNDFPIGTKFSLFTEIDFLWEDIGFSAERSLNRISTPVTTILSYYPDNRWTIYGLLNASPFFTPTLDYFAQAGLGLKYNFSDAFGIEALYTKFTNNFLQQNNGQASTINFGFRISK